MDDAARERLSRRIMLVLPMLNERQRRLYLAAEALTSGEGSVSLISKISGASRNTISAGIRELESSGKEENGDYRQKERKSGAGRKKIQEEFPELQQEMGRIMLEHGRKTSLFQWCGLSIRSIQDILKEKGYWIGKTTVANTLKDIGYIYYDSAGDYELFSNVVNYSVLEGSPVIEVENAGYETDRMPAEVLEFTKKWWNNSQIQLISTFPEAGVPSDPRIRYVRYPTGYFRWDYRRICATLKSQIETDEKEGRYIFWQLH